jgi:rhamnulokinase
MVAADLGAQSGRIALGRFDGERLDVSEVHRFSNVPVRTRATLSWDILRLYQDVLDGLRAAGRDAGRIDSVGVDAWAVDFGLLDRSGRLLGNPVHYRDARRAAAVDGVFARIPPRELYERTGIQLMPINTIFELAGMATGNDPVLAAADTLLLIPDLVHYWLCGSRVVERTNATTTQCFDPRAGGWAGDLLARLELPPGLFPEVVLPGTTLGPLAPDVADEVQIEGATVVAVGTHDTASAVAAIPFRQAGSAYISAGTWSLVGVEVDGPVIDDRTFAANLTNEGGVAGTVRLLKNVAGLWILHECRRAWALEGRDFAFEELVSEASEAPQLRALIDPDDALFADPGSMPAKVAEFCVATRQPVPESPGAVTRCVLESLALKHAQAIGSLAEATGAMPTEVHVVGGGARNELLCVWTAEAAGLPVLAGPEEATQIGNLLVQAIALGELASLDEAREVVRASIEPVLYEPSGSAVWREARDRFAELTATPRVQVEARA